MTGQPTRESHRSTAPSELQTVLHAFIWRNGVMTDLGTLGGIYSAAYDIDTRGQVVGESVIANSYYRHAFIWEQGVMTDLGSLIDFSSGYDINAAGQIAGVSETNADVPNYRATLWRPQLAIALARARPQGKHRD